MFSTAPKYGLPFANLPSPPQQQPLCGGEFYGTSPSRQYTEFKENRHPTRDVYLPLPPFSGLKTPPTDDMSAACHQPVGPYDAHALPAYPPTVFSHSQREKPLPQAIYHRTQQQQQQQQQQSLPQPQPQARLPTLDQLESRSSSGPSIPRLATTVVADGWSSMPLPSAESGQLSRSSTPSSVATMSSLSKENMSRQLTDHSSEIPDFISPRGGSLADFVAQIACFFWFESTDVLRVAERPVKAPMTVRRLHPESIPQAGFKKWCYTILSTTQVTRNVILLALLFIYRLKMLNPAVKGRAGSEYRLVTVALMLGNKFLDDNTYTNKTWADVSMISVNDIHLMEVEFLSNMRYSLLTTKNEWEDWLEKLRCFYDYYGKALDLAELAARATPTIAIPTSPNHAMYRSPNASPTASGHNLAPTTPTAYSPGPGMHANGQNWVSTLSPLSNKPAMAYGNGRKRSIDEDLTEPPAKRPAHGHGQYSASIPSSGLPRPAPLATGDHRLPVPSLTINTNAVVPTPVSMAYTPTSAMAPSHVSLPPLALGVRAMSTVYPQATAVSVAQQQQPQPAPVPVTSSMMVPSSATYATAALPTLPHAALGYVTPTKSQSQPTMAPTVYNSSPITEPYQPGSAVHTPVIHTPIANSPSIYLQQRPSPYKPIRHVKTLLRPPQSSSLQDYHLAVPQTVPPSQMHYQPLGRRNDLRTGIVPEFMPPSYLGHAHAHPQSHAQHNPAPRVHGYHQ